MTTKTVKVAMLSFAHQHAIGYAMVLNALPDVEITVIADEDADRGQHWAQTFNTQWVASIDEALAMDVDCVVVCSENVHHKTMTIAAAKAGKHVLCEKPLATTVDDATSMIAACEEAGVQLMTAFPVRFNASILALKDAVHSEHFGETLTIAARNPGTNPGQWFVDPALSGGGAVIDHTVHVVDVLRFIYGAEVTEVYAQSGNKLAGGVSDDTGLLMFKLSNGVPVSLDTSWTRPSNWPIWGGVTLDVIGEFGVLFANAYNNNYDLAETTTPSYTWQPVEHTGDPEMVSAFIDAVRNGTDVPVTGTDGLRALEVALAAMKSAESNQLEPITHA
ncbi:MAG: Gfo/Idh/MocA family oxidoreductase [Thermomicrobiales bacterium]|nr:Gfo/Idh/MocA family oxidoreductase [Thermomicrobiales bacterium]